MSYELIDRFLRNNLGDDDYAEYSEALDSICPREWQGLTDDMTYGEFLDFVRAKCMYETIYDDSDGRTILVIRMLDAYKFLMGGR